MLTDLGGQVACVGGEFIEGLGSDIAASEGLTGHVSEGGEGLFHRGHQRWRLQTNLPDKQNQHQCKEQNRAPISENRLLI